MGSEVTSKVVAVVKSFVLGNMKERNQLIQKNLQKRSRGRICRIEELEGREMLSVNLMDCGAFTSQHDGFNDDAFVEVSATNNDGVVIFAPAASPDNAPAIDGSDADENDWKKVCAAKADNGLQDEHITWTEVGSVWRLTKIDAQDVSLYGNLDLSNCTALEYLDCDDNQLISLNVSGCSVLEILHCQGNNLTSLDVSDCTDLVTLHCEGNRLESLDLSNCINLEFLYCEANQLTSLNVSDCTVLTELRCRDNQLESLDVSGCADMWILDCSRNRLSSLDVSGCVILEYLDCSGNQLTSLDVSKNTVLTALHCDQLVTKDKTITTPKGTGYPATVKGMKAVKKGELRAATVSSVGLAWTRHATKDKDTTQIVIDIHGPKPKGKDAPLIATVTINTTNGTITKKKCAQGADVKVFSTSIGFEIVVNGLASGTKYTFEMQASKGTGVGDVSKMTKVTASTTKYVAPKNKSVTGKDRGEATINWLQSTETSNRKLIGTNRIYEIGVLINKEWLFGADAENYFATERIICPSTVLGTASATGLQSQKITGLAAQKYTFGVRETIMVTNGINIDDTAVSAITKFSVAPATYKAPKFVTPVTAVNGTIELNLKGNYVLSVFLRNNDESYRYEVGVYDTKSKQYVWGVATGLGNDTENETGMKWTISNTTFIKKGLKIAIREVIIETKGTTVTVVAKSAIQTITLK